MVNTEFFWRLDCDSVPAVQVVREAPSPVPGLARALPAYTWRSGKLSTKGGHPLAFQGGWDLVCIIKIR
jgi:hypothetical protein